MVSPTTRSESPSLTLILTLTKNEVCISLRGYGWLDQFTKRFEMPVYKADGTDFLATFHATRSATDHVRKKKRPAVLVVDKVPRRFGHAATDRQMAYLEREEITTAMETDPLAGFCAQAVEAGVVTYPELLEKLDRITALAAEAFAAAVEEPKITDRETLFERTSQPLSDVVRPRAQALLPALAQPGCPRCRVERVDPPPGG